MKTQSDNSLQSSSSIDFSALAKADFFSRNANYFSAYLSSMVVLFGIAMLFVAVMGKWGVVLVITCLIAGAIFYTKAKKAVNRHQAIYREFANTNNFLYTVENKDIHENGTLYLHGYNHIERDVLEGTLCGLPMKLSDYHYETGGGKSHANYDIRVMKLELPRKLPHMVIDCLVENGENSQSTLPIRFDKSQKIDLEGDFYKYFALYAPDTYGISALTIIAPDAMDTLLRIKALCDIEIIDNSIYFYWPDTKGDPESYKSAFQTVESVMKEIGTKLIEDDIFATKSQARVHAEAVGGVKLKRSSLTAGTIFTFLVIAVVFFVQPLPNMGFTYELVALQWSIVAGAVVWTIYKSVNRSRKLKQLNERYHTEHKN